MIKKPEIVSATFSSSDRDRVQIEVNMSGDHWEFGTGNLGFKGSDHFEWKGKSWKVNFLATVRLVESPTTYGLLGSDHQSDVSEADFNPPNTGYNAFALASVLEQRKRREAGWCIHKVPGDPIHSVPCGVSALCELPIAVLPKKKGGFASFYVELGNYLYLAKIAVKERSGPSAKPTSWDWSKGAKAGLPSLGKRR